MLGERTRRGFSATLRANRNSVYGEILQATVLWQIRCTRYIKKSRHGQI
jgi:hypothetical protein